MLLPDEWKGGRNMPSGGKDHMLIGKVLLCETRRKKTVLSVTWIAYRKAYDIVAHSWIWDITDDNQGQTYNLTFSLHHL